MSDPANEHPYSAAEYEADLQFQRYMDELREEIAKQAADKEALILPCKLWKVLYPQWNGEFRIGYTSREECAKECADIFGWTVEENAELAKKKSTLEQDTISVKRHYPVGGNAGGPIPYNLIITEWCDPPNIERNAKNWEKLWIQKGLFYAMEMRRPLLPAAKSGPLEKLVLPKDPADFIFDCFRKEGDERFYLFNSGELEWISRCSGKYRMDDSCLLYDATGRLLIR